jgi:hypothetical protein
MSSMNLLKHLLILAIFSLPVPVVGAELEG